jgi:hypothetical protein
MLTAHASGRPLTVADRLARHRALAKRESLKRP